MVSPRGTSSTQGTRMLRTRLVLMALPGFIVLVFLTSAYYRRDVSSERIVEPSTSNSIVDQGEQQRRRDECRAQWYGTGTICKQPPQQWSRQDKLDLVWTWSISSLSSSSPQSNYSRRDSSHLLRYSFRSAQQRMQSGFGTVTLLTPDAPTTTTTTTPAAGTADASEGFPPSADSDNSSDESCTHTYTDDQGVEHAGQRPCWLLSANPVYVAPKVVHHRQVACAEGSGLEKHSCSQASVVSASALASTSTLLAALAPEPSDVRLVISPHHIFAAQVSASDFWSPLYGSSFRLVADAATGDIPTADAKANTTTLAEDGPLMRANALLTQRFGPRPRRKLLELPQPMSRAVVAELLHTWPNELSPSAADATVDLATLHAHYMFERHREALLWSFLIAKHDRDGDGVYSTQEAAALLRDLGATEAKNPTFPPVVEPLRSTTDATNMARNLNSAGLAPRLSHQYIQSSMDGTALYQPRAPTQSDGSSSPSSNAAENVDSDPAGANEVQAVCQLEAGCFEYLQVATASGIAPSVSQLFSILTQQAPNCGDCILMHLVNRSGQQGLSAFLPASDSLMPSLTTLPQSPTFQGVDFSIQAASHNTTQVRRLDVVTGLLSRYSHSVLLEESHLTPTMPNRTATSESLSILEFFNASAVYGFRQHGKASQPSRPEDAWIWTKYVRAWLSVRYPFAMRFEAPTTAI